MVSIPGRAGALDCEPYGDVNLRKLHGRVPEASVTAPTPRLRWRVYSQRMDDGFATPRRAVLAGATGLVGHALLPLLLASKHYRRV